MNILQLLIAGLLLLPASVQAAEDWVITEFVSDIEVQQEGAVVVTESIGVDFDDSEKHGIIREIPYVYDQGAGQDVYTRVENISVLQDGSRAEVEVSRSGDYVSIRIGDPNVTISGEHQYEISYSVIGVLQSFDGFDELNWNVTGNGWDVPIKSSRATVRVPAGILQSACYRGLYGSNTPCEFVDSQPNTAEFSAANLGAGEGLTVAVGFEQGIIPIVTVPKPVSLIDVFFSPVLWGVAGLLTIVSVSVIVRHGVRYGRDRYWQRAHLPGVRSDRDGNELAEKRLPLFHRHVIAVEYDSPDDLRPAEVGVLMDERADTLDISATIVDLASRGYLEITEIPKKWRFGKTDYEFNRTKKEAADLLRYEQELLSRMFEDGSNVKVSDLKDSFYKDLQKVKELLYKEVVAKKLFPSNPNTVRKVYLGVGVVVVLVSVGLFFLLAAFVGRESAVAMHHIIIGSVAVAGVVSGIALVVASFYMPRKTGYGRELYERVLGYELFVSRTEKYRAKFLEKEGLFFEVLPYAIVFGVTDKLAKAFKEMDIEQPSPSWYHGSGPFHAAVFASNMNDFSSSLGTAMASAPSSSGSGGGGFSGGGFGGGGGGSW